MAVAIGYALHRPPLVLFSLITVGFASNALGGAGGPLAVLFVAVLASEAGKAVSQTSTKVEYPCYTSCYHWRRYRIICTSCTGSWKSSHERWEM